MSRANSMTLPMGRGTHGAPRPSPPIRIGRRASWARLVLSEVGGRDRCRMNQSEVSRSHCELIVRGDQNSGDFAHKVSAMVFPVALFVTSSFRPAIDLRSSPEQFSGAIPVTRRHASCD